MTQILDFVSRYDRLTEEERKEITRKYWEERKSYTKAYDSRYNQDKNRKYNNDRTKRDYKL